MSATTATEGDRVANDSSDRQRRKNKSIIDGTDDITRAASAKRASRVVPGMFFDASIHYFGETVVIWDVREFMGVKKWREDAIRRSRNNGIIRKMDRLGAAAIAVDGCGVGGGKRKCEDEGHTPCDGPIVVAMGEDDEGRSDFAGRKEMPSRKKRFRAICDRLYQNSLKEEGRSIDIS
ncbi:hypothetical protein ACHAXA_000953 [Cyclostephanos tholiformis]|uniref:Uncharacterized protein n=1 Tax=Cyclostephanos tholiformis TaxID=382380 RepID=A0ABD3R5N5_9STRA